MSTRSPAALIDASAVTEMIASSDPWISNTGRPARCCIASIGRSLSRSIPARHSENFSDSREKWSRGLQLGRLWVILSLGEYWTTRIVTLPGAPLVRTGPFRHVRHPNYLLVIAEIAVLPLAFGAIEIATAFSAFNLVLIARRIRIEESVLAPRRGL